MNTKITFTPGPWRVVVWDGEGPLLEMYGVASTDETGNFRPPVHAVTEFCGKENALANARLIAASPLLLEACEAFEIYENAGDDPVVEMLTYAEARAKIRAAIAEARGETP